MPKKTKKIILPVRVKKQAAKPASRKKLSVEARQAAEQKEKETVAVRYWGLIAIIRNRKVKVIIRQVGNGQKHFFSIIPAWTINHYNNTKIISTAKGDLSSD